MPSPASTMARAVAGCQSALSSLAIKRVPMATPAAPRQSAAASVRPLRAPPESSTGTETASVTLGTRTNVCIGTAWVWPPIS